MGSVTILNSKKIAEQPIVSFDWHQDKQVHIHAFRDRQQQKSVFTLVLNNVCSVLLKYSVPFQSSLSVNVLCLSRVLVSVELCYRYLHIRICIHYAHLCVCMQCIHFVHLCLYTIRTYLYTLYIFIQMLIYIHISIHMHTFRVWE